MKEPYNNNNNNNKKNLKNKNSFKVRTCRNRTQWDKVSWYGDSSWKQAGVLRESKKMVTNEYMKNIPPDCAMSMNTMQNERNSYDF